MLMWLGYSEITGIGKHFKQGYAKPNITVNPKVLVIDGFDCNNDGLRH